MEVENRGGQILDISANGFVGTRYYYLLSYGIQRFKKGNRYNVGSLGLIVQAKSGCHVQRVPNIMQNSSIEFIK